MSTFTHSFRILFSFERSNKTAALSAQNYSVLLVIFLLQKIKKPWQDIEKIIDKAHKRVCGLAKLSDMDVLLKRNNQWNYEIQNYLTHTLSSIVECAKTYMTKQARKISLNSLNRSFNELVCIDHFNLGDIGLCHIMDATTRYSVGADVPHNSMQSAISFLDAHWISPCRTPNAIQYDLAFNNHGFSHLLYTLYILNRPMPALGHDKNFLEPKHKIRRNIFLRIKESSETINVAI